MGERPVAFEGANLGLVIAVVAVVLTAGVIGIGPGNQRLARERETLADAQKRLDAWRRQQEDTRSASSRERSSWDQRFHRLSRLGTPAAEDDASLMAWVAARLDAPSVEDLQVQRTQVSEDEDDDVEAWIAVPDPEGEEDWELQPVPLRVRFDAGYADAASLLRRLGAHLSPIRIERLEMRRHYPKVRVQLDVTLWTHREATS